MSGLDHGLGILRSRPCSWSW